MALMEYCLVNIVLGDGAGKPKVGLFKPLLEAEIEEKSLNHI
jgi:hypothetical protein